MSAVAFTGNRDIKPEKELMWHLHDVIVDHIENKGCDVFYNGLAIGFDFHAARIVIKLKEKYPHIKLIGCVPCKDQDKLWSKVDKEMYQHILKNCDEIIHVSEEEYQPYLMQRRNEYMILHCQYVISVYNYSGKGGTYNCLTFAEKKDKEITIIKP